MRDSRFTAPDGTFAVLRGKRICRTATVPFYIAAHLKSPVEFLRSLGADLTLVSSPGPELRKLEPGRGLRHIPIPISRRIAPMADLLALCRLIRLFRQTPFDIVHSTTPKAGLLTAIAAWLTCTPIRLHTWTGQQWVTLKGPVRWFSRWADRLIGLLNTQCYADSQSQRRFLIEEGIVTERKISVIGVNSLSGVDVRRFDPKRYDDVQKRQLRRDLAIPDDHRILVFVGRVTEDKGIRELLAAFSRLRRRHSASLLLVGPLDEECGGIRSIGRREIEGQADVHLVGYTAEPEKYLAISDVFCLPSYREGFGTVVIEAAAMGLPAVGTRINGLVDAIIENETGLLVEPRDDQALTKAVQFLFDHPAESEKLGRTARQRCLAHFTTDKMNHALAKEYLRLMGFSE